MRHSYNDRDPGFDNLLAAQAAIDAQRAALARIVGAPAIVHSTEPVAAATEISSSNVVVITDPFPGLRVS